MAIRLPLQVALDYHSSIAAAGTDAATCILPQDTDSVTVMLSSSVFGIATLNTYIQTTPDGGSTWYDMANLGQMTAVTGPTTATAAAAPFVAHFDTSGAVQANGVASTVNTGSVILRDINQVTSSAVAAGTYSGTPLMSRLIRVFHKATGTGASDIRTIVYVHQQSNHS